MEKFNKIHSKISQKRKIESKMKSIIEQKNSSDYLQQNQAKVNHQKYFIPHTPLFQ